MIGVTIGSYEIAERIGSGGVADVYRAIDPLLGRSVAIKFLRADLGDRADVVARFHAEARTLAQLVHPNIALLYCLLREGPHLGMVMEYVEGRTFAQILRASGRLAPEAAIRLMYQALDGIDHAHQAGVVHRDIKSSNLMLASSGCVKVMDFGISRCLGADRATRHGHLVGTMQYMSPEQVRGGVTDVRSDVYALGVLLYEMLTGELPFDSDNDYELCRAQIEEPPRPPRSLVPELSESLEAVVLRALAKDPSARFPDVLELRGALQHTSLRPATTKHSLDREAPVTRELALEDAEQIARASTLVFTAAASSRPAPAAAASSPEADSTAVEVVAAPAKHQSRRVRVAVLACALVLLAIVCGVKLVHSEKRAEPRPRHEAHTAEPLPAAPASLTEAAPEPAEVAAPIAKQPAPKRAAKAKSKAPQGESGWVIRRQ